MRLATLEDNTRFELGDSARRIEELTRSKVPSFHVYGKHVNHTERSKFDPEQHTEQTFIVRVEE